MSHMCDGL